jgi:protein SCO1/2
MPSRLVCSIGVTLLVVFPAACRRASEERTLTLQGQVVAVAPDHLEATIKHEEIKTFMPAMTMPYKVRDAALLEAIAPGDLINARLIVTSNDAYLSEVRKVGQAPLEAAPAAAPQAASGVELLKPGDAVPDGRFVDQDGKPRTLRSFKGTPVVLTFIYTRCPMPTFCPLMDRHFATIQKQLKGDSTLKGRVHLVSVSFDPATDTPPVLKKHARTLDADSRIWTFLTGNRDDIDQFAAGFGVSVTRALNDPRDITHTLRTAIIDADGRLVKVYTGNEWTPEQILADIQPVLGTD